MKIIIFMFLVVLFVFSNQTTFSDLTKRWQNFLLKFADQCIEETGVNRCRALRLLPYGEFVDDYKLKCFTRCISANLDITDKNGTVDAQRFLYILGIDETVLNDTSAVEKCFLIKREDPCEAVFDMSECTYKTIEREMNKKES